MKNIFPFLLISLFILPVHAKLDEHFQENFKKICITAGDAKNKSLSKICECIAKAHFESAKKEPVEAEAKADLKWLLDYYQIKNEKKRTAFASSNPAIAEYDLSTAEECAEKNHGK